MKNATGVYPRPTSTRPGRRSCPTPATVLLTETDHARVGLDRALSAALATVAAPTAVHDPAKVVLDLARRSRRRRGLPGRRRGAARRARRVRPGRVGPDGVPHDRPPRPGRRPPRCARSTPPAPQPGRERGRWPVTTPPTTAPMPVAADHRRRRHPGHRALGQGRRCADVQDAGSGTIRCGRSSTTAPPAPGSRWRCCCAPGTPASNTAADHITVIRAALRQLPGTGPGTGPAARSWSASTAPAPPTSCWTGCTGQRLSYSVGFGLTRAPWSTCSPRSRPATGRPPTTPTANPARAPGSSKPPG